MPLQPSKLEPRWVTVARRYIGLREIPGPKTEPNIWRWLGMIRAQWLGGDEAAWCGTAAAGWMLESGIQPPPNPFRALSWASWGTELALPVLGAVGVMTRLGGGHVTIIVGQDSRGNLLGLGGNQSDGVRVSAFPRNRFVAFRYPPGEVRPVYASLPYGDAAVSTREA